MSNSKHILALMVMLTALLAACTGNESSGYTSISSDGWIYGDTVYFTPGQNAADYGEASTDSAAAIKGDVSIVIRHNNSYEYSNLWVEMQYHNADSVVTDTINILLADDFGNWLGKGSGVSYQHSQKVLDGATISNGSPIRISHIMRVDTLRNIEQVGVVFLPD